MGKYITALDVRKFLMLEFTSDDPPSRQTAIDSWIEDRISAVENKIEEECATTWSAPYPTVVEVHDRPALAQWYGNNLGFFIRPFRYPIRSVIRVDLLQADGQYQILNSDQYTVYPETNAIFIRHYSITLPRWNSVRVEYTYGFDAPPAELKEVIRKLVVLEMYQMRHLNPYIQRTLDIATPDKNWRIDYLRFKNKYAYIRLVK